MDDAFDHDALGIDKEMTDVFDDLAFNPEDSWSPWSHDVSTQSAEVVVGTPEIDATFGQPQQTDFTCAVATQMGILNEFGVEISEAQLVYDAVVNGWLTEDGISPENVGKLLELYGVPTHSSPEGATVEDLLHELLQGNKVIAGVDSGELWGEDTGAEDNLADHAVWVTGIRRDSGGEFHVTLNDTGLRDGSGIGSEYSLHQFVEAWKDSGGMYVATNDAPGDFIPVDSNTSSALAASYPGLAAKLETVVANVTQSIGNNSPFDGWMALDTQSKDDLFRQI